jgi:hypothetical protein
VTYLLGGFEARDTVSDLLRQRLGLGTRVFRLELLGKRLQVVHSAGHTPPSAVDASWVALPVHPEGGIVEALHQEVAALVAIRTPRLNRHTNVKVVCMAGLVLLVDERLDFIGGGKGPEN